jgi:flavin reductase (DIM6/NTAB) family NADH-FMN oxidoreductase RutF
MVVVRPQRYTFGFMERSPDFTLSAFDRCYREALNLLGSRSGRDGDKVAASGLTPCGSQVVRSPCFREAALVLECRKIYRDRIDPQGFLDREIHTHYPSQDYHAVYFGEVLRVEGTDRYVASGSQGLHGGRSGR